MKNETPDDKERIAVNTRPSSSERPAPSMHFPDTSKSVNLEGTELPEARDQLPYSKPPKSKKKLFVVAVAVAVLIIAAGVAAVYFLLMQQPAQSDNDTDPLAAATKFETPQRLVEAVEPDLDGTVVEVKSSTGVSAVDGDGIYAYGVPSYKAGDAKFRVLPLEMTGTAYKSNSVSAAKNYSALKQFFESNKFAKKFSDANAPGTVSDVNDAVNYVAYAEYESSSLLCMIRHADATPTKANAHIVGVGCADKASYGKAVAKLQPFYKAYTDSGSIFSDNLAFGFLEEVEREGGYKYAKIYQEDDKQFDTVEDAKQLTGLYVQSPGKSDWSYFTVFTVDTVPMCAAYNSDTLKNVFKGFNCYDEATQKYAQVQ